MNAETTAYVLSLLTASIVSFVLAYYAWTRPRQPTTTAFAVLALGQGLWTLCFALDPLIKALSAKLLLDHLEWVFGYLSVLSSLWFALAYTGRHLPGTRLAWTLIMIPALFFVLLAFTDDMHHLMYGTARVDASGLFYQLQVEYTPISIAAYFYAYAFVPVILWVLIRHSADSSASFHAQTVIICAGLLIPVAISITGIVLYASSPLSAVPLGIGYAVGTILIAAGVFRFRVFRAVPIARNFVIDTISDAVIVVDLHSRIVDFNQAARTFADANVSQPVGRSFAEAFPRWLDEFKGLWSSDNLDTHFVSEVDGRRQHFDLKIRSINDRRGKCLGRLAVVRDISEQARLEELKISEEALKVALQKERELSALKSRMMIKIAHEFRTPLTIISLNGETLEKYFDRISEEQRREKIVEMREQIRHLTEILENITTVARGQYSVPQDTLWIFNIAELCYERAEAQRSSLGTNHTIRVSTQSPERRIHADRHSVSTIVMNLLSNAINYSPDGSTVRLEQWFDGDDLLLQITDEGIGISDDDLKRIFEPFFRGDNTEDVGGLGLGLSIVRDYVNLHHGEISVVSRVGHGSTFTVRLPKVALTG